MDRLNIIFNIISTILNEPKTIKEISHNTKIDIDLIKDILAFDLRAYSRLLKFWQIEIYDSQGNSIEDKLVDLDLEEGIVQSYRELLEDDCEVNIWFNTIKTSSLLNKYEKFCLYDIIMESDKNFLNSLKTKLNRYVDKDIKNRYQKLTARRIIKHYNNLFDIDIDFIIQIINAIKMRRKIDIVFKDKKFNAAVPLNLVYNNDTDRWYLEIYYKGIKIIKLNNIQSINILEEKYEVKKYKLKAQSQIVKIRVFDEKNAIDRALRYLSRRNILTMENNDGFIDITTKVNDINIFKRWIRTLGVSCIILEPENLRNEFKSRLIEWEKIYKE